MPPWWIVCRIADATFIGVLDSRRQTNVYMIQRHTLLLHTKEEQHAWRGVTKYFTECRGSIQLPDNNMSTPLLGSGKLVKCNAQCNMRCNITIATAKATMQVACQPRRGECARSRHEGLRSQPHKPATGIPDRRGAGLERYNESF